MIYLSNDFMELYWGFSENNFTKKGDTIYFTAHKEEENKFLCVTLKEDEKLNIPSYKIDVAMVKTDVLDLGGGEIKEIIKNKEKVEQKDKEYALKSFFRYISHSEGTHDVMFFEGTYPLIKEYVSKGHAYGEGSKIFIDFLDCFQISGEVNVSYYGNLYISDVKMSEKTTGAVIKRYEEISLNKEICDSSSSILEAFVSCLSEADIYRILDVAV